MTANAIFGEQDALEASAPPPGRIQERYGVVADAGFQPLPDVLLFHQADLGLRSEDLNVLLNVLAHWYHPGSMPFIRATTIAKRMGVSPRTVQRSLQRLRTQRFLGRGADREAGGETFDLTPLIEKLRPYAVRKIEYRELLKRHAAEKAP